MVSFLSPKGATVRSQGLAPSLWYTNPTISGELLAWTYVQITKEISENQSGAEGNGVGSMGR